MDDPQVVRPHVDAMEDLQWNPARLAEFKRQERLGISEGHPGASPAPLHTHTPHLSIAQRRANQAGQPRDGVGKYAEKPASKWKQLSSSGSAPVAPTSLKRVKTPARPTAPRRATFAASRPALQQQKKRKPTPMPPMHAMLDKPLHQKVGWVVRRWFRRKKKHLKALFSLKG